jgi:hydroxymethylglutaryl-CoA lyase
MRLRDVTLRDGLQDTAPIGLDAKLSIFDSLLTAGVSDFEVTSFARPDRVPALADAEAFATRALSRKSSAVLWGLVLNARGAQRALACGIRNVQFVLSISEAHNANNAGRSVDESLAELADIVAIARDGAADLEVTLATAFGCPYDGPVNPGAVVNVAQRVSDLGVRRVSLADTIGTAIPDEVESLVARVRDELDFYELGVHLHDTRGLAIANALAAMRSGATRLDGTVGGLGGCPFAPGASGNLVLEDLVHVLEESGVDTGINLPLLIEASNLTCDVTAHAQASHVAVARPRFERRFERSVSAVSESSPQIVG